MSARKPKPKIKGYAEKKISQHKKAVAPPKKLNGVQIRRG